MVLGLFLAFLLFGCTLERDNPYDPYGINYDPSLYPNSSSLFSSSSLLAEVSSSSGVSDDSSSSSGEAGSSSSLPPVMVFCQLSDGICPLTQISQEACDFVGGTPVQACAESSSSAPPSSSSIAPSSSSSAPSSSSLALSSSFLTLIGKGNNINNYKTIVIGAQTWMAENLYYVVEGSRCYDNDLVKCDTYGSLYDWATAMALPSSCNSNNCSNQIQSPHRGICPDGWHIPSQAEWNTLSSYVQSNSGCSICDASLLKAASGWNSDNGASGNGTDDYGFSALPGGSYWGSSFHDVGDFGFWWSASGYNTRYMRYYHGYAYWADFAKSYRLQSVRCVQDSDEKPKGNNISNYRTVVIGTQTWMAENLDYVVEGSRCYDNNPAYCNTYGSRYDWATAMDLPSNCNSTSCSSLIQSPHQGICPSGWHIPSSEEWGTLTSYVGSSPGAKLKAASGWDDCGPSGSGRSYLCEDSYGFSALPGGGDWGGIGYSGEWWSANERFSDIAFSRYMNYYYDDVYSGGLFSNYKSRPFSVRCVQD